MPEAIVKGRILKWGNSLGVRISMRDARRLKLRPGSEVTVHIETHPAEVDLSVLPVFRGGGRDGRDHDRLLGEARSKELRT